MLGIVFWVLGTVFWALGIVFWVLGLVFWVLGLVFWVRAKTRIFLNIWPLAWPNIAENLLGEKVVLACGAKTSEFRNPKS